MKTPTKKKKKVVEQPTIPLRRFKFRAFSEGMDVIFPIEAVNVDEALKSALGLCTFREWEYKGRIPNYAGKP